MSGPSSLVGVIMAGGRSRRLGQDKARLVLEDGGRDLLARTAQLLGRVTAEVHVSGRDPADQGLTLPWFLDDVPGKGPVGGILTALRRLQRHILVLSCDLPLMDLPTLQRLASAHLATRGTPRPPRQGETDGPLMITYAQPRTGYIESLVAIYSPAAVPVLEAALARGLHKLSAIIPRAQRLEIPYVPDPDGPFFNLNTPADLRLLRAMEISPCILHP